MLVLRAFNIFTLRFQRNQEQFYRRRGYRGGGSFGGGFGGWGGDNSSQNRSNPAEAERWMRQSRADLDAAQAER